MLKVLVVEDELYAREALVKLIREYDMDGQFLIQQAVNGEEGELVYNRERPELVLTDIRMPKMDGLALLARIRQRDNATQVVILSAYSDFEYARTALSNGAAEYQVTVIRFREKKPDVQDFLSEIEKMYEGIPWEKVRLLNPDFES